MGWRFQWVSSFGNDFNFDYHVSFSQDDLAKGAGYYNYVMKKPISEEQPGASVSHHFPPKSKKPPFWSATFRLLTGIVSV